VDGQPSREFESRPIRRLQAKLATETKFWFGALTARLNLLDIHLKQNDEYWIGSTLSDITELFDKGFTPEADEAIRLGSALDKVPDKFRTEKGALRARLEKARGITPNTK
jgi:hypothetical protein